MSGNAQPPSQAEEEAWASWVDSRPEPVRSVASRFFPWKLYRLKDSDKVVTLYSFNEDGTMTVDVRAEFNFVVFERRVFGVNPDDLSECHPSEVTGPTGAMLTDPADIEAYCEAVRREATP